MQFCARSYAPIMVESFFSLSNQAGYQCGSDEIDIVIKAYAHAGDLRNAKVWCSKKKDAGLTPPVHECTCLLRACGPRNDRPANPDEGRRIFLSQLANSIAPNHDNLQALASALGQRECQRLLQDLHVHQRAANLSWWPDARNLAKPSRLAKQMLGTSREDIF